MVLLVRRLIGFIVIIGLVLSSFIGTFTVYAEPEVDVTYKTIIRQKREITVEFAVNETYVGYFKLRTSPTFDKSFTIFLDYSWARGRLVRALGEDVTISSVMIIYEIYEGDRSVARGAIYDSSSSKIVNIVSLVGDAKELVRYDVKKLECVATVTRSGKNIGVVVVDFIDEIKREGLDKLFFIKSLEKHSLTLKPEVKDPGWIEAEILRASRKVGLIRFVGDPHFKDTRLFYVNFQLFEYEMVPFYKLRLDINAVDTDSHEERRLNYTLLPGEEFFMPGNVTLADLGVTEYERVKSFDVTSFILTLKTPVTKFMVNATEKVGVIPFKAVAGPILISDMELKSSRELGNGWYYWQVSAHTALKLKNAEVVFRPIGGSVKPIFVKVISYRYDEIGEKTLLLDVLGLFDRVGVFDGNITVRIVLENYEVRDYSLRVRSQIFQVASQTVENIDVSNITSVHLREKLELEIHRSRNLLRYGLVPEADEPEFREALEELQKELEALSPYDDYIEYAFPIGRTVGKYDYVTLSYQYELKPASNRAVEIRYTFDIQDQGYKDPFSILGDSFNTMPKVEYWPSSFTGSRYVLRQLGGEDIAVGYVHELYDDEGRPVDKNFVEALYVRLQNVEDVNISDVTLQFHRVAPPEIEFPYAYSAAVSDAFASRSSLLQTYLERGPLLWLLFIIFALIVSYNVVAAIRSRRSRVEG
ncbi:MAG: hypothetical protein ACE5KU_04110 [Nitrososphaerales archaeon]